VGSEFPVNSFSVNDQRRPALAIGSAGGFVVVWQSRGQDRSRWGVFAQRFAIPSTTATPTFTPTATPTVTPTPTSSGTTMAPEALYAIPTLSRIARAILALAILAVSFAFLLWRKVG
jgi:hypothetical protein